MYQGYRVYIEAYKVPETMIEKGSFSFKKEPRVIDSWTDANGIDHEVYAQKKRVTMSFKIREHDSSIHDMIGHYFHDRSDVQVAYFDDEYNDYQTGKFKMYGIEYKHHRVFGGKIMYEPTQVILREY